MFYTLVFRSLSIAIGGGMTNAGMDFSPGKDFINIF
jgi:hypothetical protein